MAIERKKALNFGNPLYNKDSDDSSDSDKSYTSKSDSSNSDSDENEGPITLQTSNIRDTRITKSYKDKCRASIGHGIKVDAVDSTGRLKQLSLILKSAEDMAPEFLGRVTNNTIKE